MRLIDADQFLSDEGAAYMSAQIKLAEANADMTIDATRYINQLVHQKIRMLISDAPTIEAVPVRPGQWIPNPFDPEWDICTACLQGTKRREHGTDRGHEWVREYGYSFCPNCGAKMSNASNASNTLETLEKGETE